MVQHHQNQFVNNMSGTWPKHVTEVSFEIKVLKDSGKRNVGRPIWVPK